MAKEERAKGCRLWEDSQGGESKMLSPSWDTQGECMWEQRKIREFFFSRETYTRNIVYWFDNSETGLEFL